MIIGPSGAIKVSRLAAKDKFKSYQKIPQNNPKTAFEEASNIYIDLVAYKKTGGKFIKYHRTFGSQPKTYESDKSGLRRFMEPKWCSIAAAQTSGSKLESKPIIQSKIQSFESRGVDSNSEHLWIEF